MKCFSGQHNPVISKAVLSTGISARISCTVSLQHVSFSSGLWSWVSKTILYPLAVMPQDAELCHCVRFHVVPVCRCFIPFTHYCLIPLTHLFKIEDVAQDVFFPTCLCVCKKPKWRKEYFCLCSC